MTWTRRQFLTIGTGAVAGAAFVSACAGDDDDDKAAAVPTTTTTTAPSALPVDDEDALKELFDPFFEPLGQKVTRIGLYDLTLGFERSDEGDHVAIYVEPIDPDGEGWDTAHYIEMLAPGMAACTPFIFDTWSGVNSMDLCQEPPQSVAPEPEPPIETQVQLSRADSAFIDWDDVELADLIAARLRSPQTARVAASDEIEQHPDWIAATEAARDLV
ncbi:hypothetical protein [Actinospongicola halichondriae]|uniref:hypothetical protein n=1 Tax=Actinospongicola halichondriae TaxID=3236844 RepID=UPI003D4D546E